jgi:nitrite reductase/ring-hydroxylating ferredoxin subunit
MMPITVRHLATMHVQPDMTEFEHLANLEELPDGTLLGVHRSNGEEVCLYNDGGRIGAVGNVCTHAAFLMSDGTLEPDGIIECAWHGAWFDSRTGKVCRGPADEPLPVFAVRVEDGRVLVGPRAA